MADLDAGRRMELEDLVGVIVHKGAQHGIPTPVIRPVSGGRKSTSVQPTSSIHHLSLRGTGNPSSRYQPLRFCLSTRGRVVPYK